MSLRTRLAALIAILTTALIVAHSAFNVQFLAEDAFRDTLERARAIRPQVRNVLLPLVNERSKLEKEPPTTVEGVKALWHRIIEEDPMLGEQLQKPMEGAPAVIEVLICDDTGRILASSGTGARRTTCRTLTDFGEWQAASLWTRIVEVFTENKDYSLTDQFAMAGFDKPILTTQVVVSSVLIRNAIAPRLSPLLWAAVVAVLAAVVIALLFARSVLRSLERVGRRIDSIALGEPAETAHATEGEAKEIAAMQSKLDLLSKQYRGAREDAMALRGNIERLLVRLEEGVLLYGSDSRLLRVNDAAESILGVARDFLQGSPIGEMFPTGTPLGDVIGSAILNRTPVRDALVALPRPGGQKVRLMVNVEVDERGQVLVTLRDLDTRRELRSQLDISTRLAAISRLTGGVAHEIKNPLNAIALHLEILRTRLEGVGEDMTEVNVIAGEIARLDRVVKTFLDFTRPLEPALAELDLAAIVRDVANLVGPDAALVGVEVAVNAPAAAAMRGDADLLKQALLNVMKNGVEAMAPGGVLAVTLERAGEDWCVAVADNGAGIPPEMRDRIFHLYFSTKKKGSGIGLAMTFRIVQLHNASIDFEDRPGGGTTFRLRFPAVPAAGFEPEAELQAQEKAR